MSLNPKIDKELLALPQGLHLLGWGLSSIQANRVVLLKLNKIMSSLKNTLITRTRSHNHFESKTKLGSSENLAE